MALPKISRGVGPQVTLFFGLHGLGGEESVAACSPLSLSEPVSAVPPPRRLSASLKEQRRLGKASKPERLMGWSSHREPSEEDFSAGRVTGPGHRLTVLPAPWQSHVHGCFDAACLTAENP